MDCEKAVPATLWQFSLIKYPTEEEAKAGREPEILVQPGDGKTPGAYFLAKGLEKATAVAVRFIPENQMPHFDRIKVAVRPF